MNSDQQTIWLAGLLEGEGHFSWHRDKAEKGPGRPRIQLQMTDKDIVERVAKLFNANLLGPYGPYTTQKLPSYFTHCSGKVAIDWMKKIQSFMGERRHARIRELLERYEAL